MLKISNDNTISLTRGDTARITLTVKQADGKDYDYSADTVLFTIKKNVHAADAILQKTVTDGVVYIAPADTAELAYGDYVYDVQLTTQAGDVCTVIVPAKFRLTDEVTWQAVQS